MALKLTPTTLRALALLALCGVLALLGVDAAAHIGRYEAWTAVRARLGTPAYDAAESDARYDAVFAARASLRRDATLLGVVLLLLAACAPAAQRSAPTNRDATSRTALRRLAATLADGALLTGLATLLALAARAADLDGSEAIAAVLGRLVWLLPPATLALALRRGLAPSSRLAPAPAAPRPLRALANALLTVPAAALVLAMSPLIVPLAARRPQLSSWLVAPHEALLARA